MKAETKEKPILFSGEMVRAILDGRKTQTRRFVKGDLRKIFSGLRKSPYGPVGGHLWVRETWQAISPDETWRPYEECKIIYRATDEHPGFYAPEYAEVYGLKHSSPVWDMDQVFPWKPSIHIPRWASRINLEITAKRFEWLQDISKSDCIAEGMLGLEDVHAGWHQPYAELWDKINGKPHKDGIDKSWDANPMILVLTFKKI